MRQSFVKWYILIGPPVADEDDPIYDDIDEFNEQPEYANSVSFINNQIARLLMLFNK